MVCEFPVAVVFGGHDDARRTKGNLTGIRSNRLAGIDDEIHDHLLNLVGVKADPEGRGVELIPQLCALRDGNVEQLRILADQAIEIEVFGDKSSLARVGEELSRQISCSFGRFRRFGQIVDSVVIWREFAHGKGHLPKHGAQ
jgi:hypothetical protein